MVQADKEMAETLAEEMKEGADKLYHANRAEVEDIYV